jgi:hypothetical protein
MDNIINRFYNHEEPVGDSPSVGTAGYVPTQLFSAIIIIKAYYLKKLRDIELGLISLSRLLVELDRI